MHKATVFPAPRQVPELPKRLANIRAQLMLRGFVLTPNESGGWTVARWGHAAELDSDEQVAEFLVRIGGPAVEAD